MSIAHCYEYSTIDELCRHIPKKHVPHATFGVFDFIPHFINILNTCTYKLTDSYNGQMSTLIHYLFVSECASSQFGPNCNSSCSKYCLDKKCNQTTGLCLSCTDARSGLFCENENSPGIQSFGMF